MPTRLVAVLLLTIGSQPGLSIQPVARTTRNVAGRAVAVEITSAGLLQSADDAEHGQGFQTFAAAGLIRNTNKENGPAQTISADDKTDLCGQTCHDIIEGGAPCRATWASGCKSRAPLGFTTLSTLYDLCPHACGPMPEEEMDSFTWLWAGIVGLPILIALAVCCLCPVKVRQLKEWATSSKSGMERYEDDNDSNDSYEDAGIMSSESAAPHQSTVETTDGSMVMMDTAALVEPTMMQTAPQVEPILMQTANQP